MGRGHVLQPPQSAMRSCRGVVDSARSRNMQSAMMGKSNLHLSAGCFALGLVVVAVWFWGYVSASLTMPLFRYHTILLTILVLLIITILPQARLGAEETAATTASIRAEAWVSAQQLSLVADVQHMQQLADATGRAHAAIAHGR